MTSVRKTVCNRDCPDACGIVATVEDGRVVKIGGDPDHPVTRGFLCYRTNHYLDTQYSPDRITTPLIRRYGRRGPAKPGREDAPPAHRWGGDFVRAGWDEALDLCAAELTRIRAESGPAAIFHYRSGGTLGALAHLSDWFFESFGPVTCKRGDICSGAGDAAQLADFGEEDSHDLFDLRNSRNILVWGKNVYVSSPHTLPLLREAAARGAGVVLIDPAHHRTAELCDRFIQPRPAGDFALAMAVARILFERGWTDPDAGAYCDHLDDFRALACSRPLAGWCEAADVTAGEADDLARRLHEGPAAILVGWGMGRRSNGAGIVRALDALGAVSGNLGIPGGGVSFYFKRRRAFDLSFIGGVRAAPRTVCEPLFGAEVLAMRDPPIRAVWITAGNPVAMLPESETVARALASRDFVVVADSWMSDTARLAHVILPTPTLLEADDLLGAYGHHWIGVAQPVVPPPPEVLSDLEILQGLAARVGLTEAMAGDARAWKRRILGGDVRAAGVTLERLEQAPQKNPLVPEVLFGGRRFPTVTGRVNLMRQAPPEPDPFDPDYPLSLLSLSTDKSQSSQWAKAQTGPAIVTVHPDAPPGLPDGALARLESRLSSLIVRVRHDPRQRRDTAILPKGGHLSAGRAANALIRARTTDAGEGAALHDARVRLIPL